MNLRRMILVPILVIAALAAGCSSNEDADRSAQDAVLDGPRPARVTEQDVSTARATYNSALLDWEESGPPTYIFEIGVETLSLVRFDIVDGEVVGETIVDDGGDSRWVEDLPKTVEEFFADVDAAISAFEDDPSIVPVAGECGAHFNVEFASDVGNPIYFDGLGPCDDGVGIRAVVVTDAG